MRLIPRDRPQGYAWDPRSKPSSWTSSCIGSAIPRTGWWGERYLRDGHMVFVDDLSTTFHVVTFLHGNVPNLSRVIDTTLAVKDLDFPVGWLFKGQYWNHNNMDVVALFKAGWPQATPAQKQAMTVEIEKMLHWCLTESLQPDGSFKPNIGDGSLEEGEYYATAFLARIGFFDKKERFWTDREFPEAPAIRRENPRLCPRPPTIRRLRRQLLRKHPRGLPALPTRLLSRMNCNPPQWRLTNLLSLTQFDKANSKGHTI